MGPGDPSHLLHLPHKPDLTLKYVTRTGPVDPIYMKLHKMGPRDPGNVFRNLGLLDPDKLLLFVANRPNGSFYTINWVQKTQERNCTAWVS
jgi:hypothetical protein